MPFSPSAKDQFITGVLRESDKLITDQIRAKWAGYDMNMALPTMLLIEDRQGGEFPYHFDLLTGGFVEMGASDRQTVSGVNRDVIYQIEYQNSHGVLEKNPPFKIGGLDIVEGIRGTKLLKDQVSALKRALVMIVPKRDFVLDVVDWKDVSKMKTLSAIGVSGQYLPWTTLSERFEESNSVVPQLLQYKNFDDIPNLFTPDELELTFGIESKFKLLRLFKALAANQSSPASISMDNFYATVVTYMLQKSLPSLYDLTKGISTKKQLSADEQQAVEKITSFCVNKGLAIWENIESDKRLVLNPHVINWIRSMVPDKAE